MNFQSFIQTIFKKFQLFIETIFKIFLQYGLNKSETLNHALPNIFCL